MFNFVTAINAIRGMILVAAGCFILLRIFSRWISTRFYELAPLMQVVNAANALKSNIWALLVIGMGVLLSCCGNHADGGTLVAVGSALFQHEAKGQSDSSPLASGAPQVPNS